MIRNLGKKEFATIRYIGETTFYSGVTWYGVELENATGKNNGSVYGVRYFRCRMNHGLFVRREMISHAGWGRQTTSRSPFKADRRELMATTDTSDENIENGGGVRRQRENDARVGMWAVDDGEAATLSQHAVTSKRVRSLFSSKKEEQRQRNMSKARCTSEWCAVEARPIPPPPAVSNASV